MPTMKDVARRAGVSLGTVSNVLNNRSSVLPENRARVMEAVEQLGFKSNMVARALKTKASNDIGLIIPNIRNPFYPELARGVEDTAKQAGYTVFLCNSDRDPDKERSYIESLIMKNACGIILVKPQIVFSELALLSKKTEMILVDSGLSADSGCNVVNVDDAGGVRQAMEFLYSYGHTRIGFVGGLLESQSSHERYQAYKEFMKASHIDICEDYLIHSNYDWTGGYQATRGFMQLPTPPTAILAANDLMAIGCMKAAREMGILVPQQLSVMGIDNIGIDDLCTPPLTTIHQPKYEMGAESAKMLLRRLEAPTEEPEKGVLLRTHVVIRDSVSAPGT